MYKKITAVLVSIITAAALTGGITGQEVKADKKKEKAETTSVKFPLKDKEKFDVFAVLNGQSDLKDNPVIQKTEKEDNIEFNFQSVMSADLQEKRNLVLASGDYPDIFYKAGLTFDDTEKYGKQGIFIPLEKMIKKYAPNLKKRLDETDGWDDITSSDGHIYSIPDIVKPDVATPTYWINEKWMNNLGLTEPKNLDELYKVLKAFKDEDANKNGDPNDEIPFTTTNGDLDILLHYFGISYDVPTRLSVIDGKLTYIPSSSVFKKFVAYVTKLYKEGILDKNAFTQQAEQQDAIGQANDVFGSFFSAGAFVTVGRDNDDDYIALTPFEDGKYAIKSEVEPATMAITDRCKHPETAVAWVDQFFTEEGGILSWMGEKDVSWRENSDGTWSWITGNGYGDDISTVRAATTLMGMAGNPAYQPDFWYDKMSPETDPDEYNLNQERAKLVKKGALPLPTMHYTKEETEELATLKTDIDSYIKQYIAQVATVLTSCFFTPE